MRGKFDVNIDCRAKRGLTHSESSFHMAPIVESCFIAFLLFWKRLSYIERLDPYFHPLDRKHFFYAAKCTDGSGLDKTVSFILHHAGMIMVIFNDGDHWRTLCEGKTMEELRCQIKKG